jgi:hypothetical protein
VSFYENFPWLRGFPFGGTSPEQLIRPVLIGGAVAQLLHQRGFSDIDVAQYKRSTAILKFISKRGTAINGVSLERLAAFESFISKRGTAISGCSRKGDTAIN